jgi:hypothetical protein
MATGINFNELVTKILLNKRVTSSNKTFYEEFGDFTINVSAQEIWAEEIDATPSVAVAAGVVQEYTLLTMTEDITVANQQTYYAFSGNRLKDWVSDKYGSNYGVHVYDNSNNEIFLTDPSGPVFNHQTGILTFEGSTAGFTKPFKISGYRYVGSKGLSTVSSNISGLEQTVQEHKEYVDSLHKAIVDVLDGYSDTSAIVGLTQTVQEHKEYTDSLHKAIVDVLDGYDDSGEVAGLTQTVQEHKEYVESLHKSIVDVLDGYNDSGAIAGLTLTVQEHKEYVESLHKSIVDVLDGYSDASAIADLQAEVVGLDQTVQEHKEYTYSLHKAITDVLDGYSVTTDISGLEQTVQEHKEYVDSVHKAVVSELDGYDTRISAIEEVLGDTNEPNGFMNRTDSTWSFSNANRRLTIQPASGSYSIYTIDSGELRKHTISSAKTVDITDTEGEWFIYLDGSATLQATQVWDNRILTEWAFVAGIYWNADDDQAELLGDERHGVTMDGATHSYLHNVFGAQWGSGLALGNLSVDGDGSSDAHVRFSVSNGSFRDEDINHVITDGSPQDLDPIAQIPIFWKESADVDWRKKTADTYPLIQAGSVSGATGTRPSYNQYTGGTWQLTEVTDNYYFLVHYFATNDINNPIMGIVGQNEYSDLATATSGVQSEFNSLLIDGLPTAEWAAIATIIFHANSTYTNNVEAIIVDDDNGSDYTDWRLAQLDRTGTSGTSASDHGNLTGLNDDDHTIYHTDGRADTWFATKSHTDLLNVGTLTHAQLESTIGGLDQTVQEHKEYTDSLHKSIVDVLDGYIDTSAISDLQTEVDGLDLTVQEHKEYTDSLHKAIVDVLDGYSDTSAITGLGQTVQEHKEYVDSLHKAIVDVLDGYSDVAAISGLEQTVQEHKEYVASLHKAIVDVLDGYDDSSVISGLDQTVQEHKEYVASLHKAITDVLDGYGSNLVGTPTDASYDGLLEITPSDTIPDTVDQMNDILALLAPESPGDLTSQSLTLSISSYSAKLPSGLSANWGSYTPGDSVSGLITTSTYSLYSPTTTTRFNGGLTLYDTGSVVHVLDSVDGSSRDVSDGIGTTGTIQITAVDTYNNVWKKINAQINRTQTEGKEQHAMKHTTVAGTSNTTTLYYDDTNDTPSFSVSPTHSVNSETLKYLSGIAYYNIGTEFLVSYTAATGIFRKAYHTTQVSVISCAGLVPVNVNPVSAPAVADTFAVTNQSVTLDVADQIDLTPNITVTLKKPDGTSAASDTATLARYICTAGTHSTTTYDNFVDEAQRLVLGSDTPWTSSSTLANGNAQVRAGTLQYANSTDYPGFTGDQSYERKIVKATAQSGTLSLIGITSYTDVSPYNTGDLNIFLHLETDDIWFDLGRQFGDDNGTGSGDSLANSKGGGNAAGSSGTTLAFTFGIYSTANNNSRYRIRIVFRNSNKSLTSITGA